MQNQWKESVDQFMYLANELGLRMLMVGGGAVSFHGYQRHSADIYFWIDTKPDNLEKLLKVFQEMGYDTTSFPESIAKQEQNISVKLSPVDLNLELITRFEIGKTFDQAYAESEAAEINKEKILKWRVLNIDDLLESKRRAARPKDLLDIMELKKVHQR